MSDTLEPVISKELQNILQILLWVLGIKTGSSWQELLCPTDLPRRKQGPPELWIFESLLPTGALARYSNFVVFLFKSQEQDRG